IDSRNELRTTSYVLFGSAIALGTTGALLYWIDLPRPLAALFGERAPEVVPTVTDDGFGATLIGRFE
ncbi:MAG: hypothetical protein AAGC55_02385, partial [Myxococcota bacterium]